MSGEQLPSDTRVWHSIESAPKLIRILACHEKVAGSHFIAIWDHNEKCFVEVNTGLLRQPTHWMHLPGAPT